MNSNNVIAIATLIGVLISILTIVFYLGSDQQEIGYLAMGQQKLETQVSTMDEKLMNIQGMLSQHMDEALADPLTHKHGAGQ